jgi:ketosteroid isomerase-like protein
LLRGYHLSGAAGRGRHESDPQRFVETLTTDGFAAMRTGNRDAAKAKFRALLAQNVAVDMIGDAADSPLAADDHARAQHGMPIRRHCRVISSAPMPIACSNMPTPP